MPFLLLGYLPFSSCKTYFLVKPEYKYFIRLIFIESYTYYEVLPSYSYLMNITGKNLRSLGGTCKRNTLRFLYSENAFSAASLSVYRNSLKSVFSKPLCKSVDILHSSTLR